MARFYIPVAIQVNLAIARAMSQYFYLRSYYSYHIINYYAALLQLAELIRDQGVVTTIGRVLPFVTAIKLF